MLREWLCEKLGVLACKILVRLGAIPVDRNKPAKLFTTMRQSVSMLESGKNILIFPETGLPEYSLTSVTPFFPGFATVGAIYYRKTGKKLRFVPCYIDQQHHLIRFGEVSVFEPEGTEITAESTRVSEELNLRIREMAAASHGNSEKAIPRALSSVLFLGNLVRFFLIIALLVIIFIPNAHVAMILYLISQGLRMLVNGIASYNYHSSSHSSSVVSHCLGLVTDIIMVAWLSTDFILLRPLFFTLVANALVILISNLTTFFRIHRLAGVNYFDNLSGNLVFLSCMLLLLNIVLRRFIFFILQIITILMLLLSAAFTIAFNHRLIRDSETEVYAE